MTLRCLSFTVFAGLMGLSSSAHAIDHRALRPHGTLGFTFGGGEITRSAYTDALAPWAYTGFTSKLIAAADGGVFVAPWLLLGGRVGYGTSSGGTTPNDGASLSLTTWDFGALARVGVPIASPRTLWFFGVELQGGAMAASISLRGQSLGRVVPSAAAGLFGQLFVGRVGFGLRYVRRFAGWSDAGGPGVDLSLAGGEFSASLEVGL